MIKRFTPKTQTELNKLITELNTISTRSPVLPSKTIVEPEVGKLTPLPIKPIEINYEREIIVSPPVAPEESKGTKKGKKKKDE